MTLVLFEFYNQEINEGKRSQLRRFSWFIWPLAVLSFDFFVLSLVRFMRGFTVVIGFIWRILDQKLSQKSQMTNFLKLITITQYFLSIFWSFLVNKQQNFVTHRDKHAPPSKHSKLSENLEISRILSYQST